MHYSYSYNILSTHVVGSELKTTFDLPSGIITDLDISFPGGCNRQVFVQIYKGATLVFPAGASQSYCENAQVIHTATYYQIDTNPTTFTFWGWGVGCNYPHKILVNINHRYWDEPG